jgi:dTDP-4-amino-4,6-dideoxygalactose transaminase
MNNSIFFNLYCLAHQSAFLDGLIIFFAVHFPFFVLIFAIIFLLSHHEVLTSKNQFVILAQKRDLLAEWLKSKGIEVAIHYPKALPNLPAYEYLNVEKDEFPISSRLQNDILSLPMYPELTEEEIKYIVDQIKIFYNNG